jgi:hypothetical protein
MLSYSYLVPSSTLSIFAFYVPFFIFTVRIFYPLTFSFTFSHTFPSRFPLFFISAFMSIVAMFLKTLRIFIIVKSGLRRRKFTGRSVITLTAVCYLLWVVYLAFITSVFPPRDIVTSKTAITGQVISYIMS